jgi:hypothetical protein
MAKTMRRPISEPDKDRELSKELEDTFPSSDPPSRTQPAGGVTGPEVVDSDDERMERIRARAYGIWREEGEIHGRDQEHWREAERQIDAEDEPGGAATVE